MNESINDVEKFAYVSLYAAFDGYGINSICLILLIISIIVGIIIKLKYKKVKPLILSIILFLIYINKMFIDTTAEGLPAAGETYIIELISIIINITLVLISFIYSTIKLVKYIKSDKFGKENKDVRND